MLCQTRLYYTKLCVDLPQNTRGRQPSQVIPKPQQPSRKHSNTIEKSARKQKTRIWRNYEGVSGTFTFIVCPDPRVFLFCFLKGFAVLPARRFGLFCVFVWFWKHL